MLHCPSKTGLSSRIPQGQEGKENVLRSLTLTVFLMKSLVTLQPLNVFSQSFFIFLDQINELFNYTKSYQLGRRIRIKWI